MYCSQLERAVYEQTGKECAFLRAEWSMLLNSLTGVTRDDVCRVDSSVPEEALGPRRQPSGIGTSETGPRGGAAERPLGPRRRSSARWMSETGLQDDAAEGATGAGVDDPT